MTRVTMAECGHNTPLSLDEAAELYGMPSCVLRSAVQYHYVVYANLGGTPVFTKNDMDELLRRPDIGTVYAVGFLKYVKIGFTRNFASRLDILQCACPLPLTVYRKFPGFTHDERDFHRRFADTRLNGEWFLIDRKLSAWIRGLGQ